MGIKVSNLITCIDCEKAYVKLDNNIATIVCESNNQEHQELFNAVGKNAARQCSGFKHLSKQRGAKIDLGNALRYMLAGKSEFTMVSLKSGARLRYKLTKKVARDKGESGEDQFIYYLNTFADGDMQYAGVLFFTEDDGQFKFGKGARGKLHPSHLNVKSLLFVLNKLSSGDKSMALEVYHAGKCGRCGKKLTTPESILTGLGPECSKKAGVPRVKIR